MFVSIWSCEDIPIMAPASVTIMHGEEEVEAKSDLRVSPQTPMQGVDPEKFKQARATLKKEYDQKVAEDKGATPPSPDPKSKGQPKGKAKAEPKGPLFSTMRDPTLRPTWETEME